MTKIFIYEFLTGGGLDGDAPGTIGAPGSAAAAEFLREGGAMRDALVADYRALPGITLTVATCAADLNPPVSDASCRTCQPAPAEDAVDFVRRMAAEHDYAVVVAPERGMLLARLHDAVGPARWLGCTGDAIRLASSKRATRACLSAAGIAVAAGADTRFGVAGASSEAASRWVVKPDDGAGGMDTRLFERFEDALVEYQRRIHAHDDPLLEAWVEGEALSLSLLCGAHEAEMLAVNRQKIVLERRPETTHVAPGALDLRFESVAVNAIDRHGVQGRVLAALAQRVAEALPGLRGFAGIDVVWDARSGPVVIEVNPRVTLAYAGMSAALGRNLARATLAAHGMPNDGRRPPSASSDPVPPQAVALQETSDAAR